MHEIIEYTIIIQSDGRIQPQLNGINKPSSRVNLEPLQLLDGFYLDWLSVKERLNRRQDFVALGTKLYEMLLKPVENSFLAAWESLVEPGKARRLRLRIVFQRVLDESVKDGLLPRLIGIPWEFLYFASEKTFLGTDQRVTLVREYQNWLNNSQACDIQLPLRVLFIHTHPRDLPEIAFVDSIKAKINALGRSIQLVDLPNPSVEVLKKKLQEFRPHVFHFLGHGTFGELKLCNTSNGRAISYGGESLGDLFRGLDVCLVLLHSCESGASSDELNFEGTAAELVERNVPAVISMRYSISQDQARRFVETFYQELANYQPIDEAVQAGRNAISVHLPDSIESHTCRDFGTPELWMRLQDGRLSIPLPSLLKTEGQTLTGIPDFPVQERILLEKYLDTILKQCSLETVWLDGARDPIIPQLSDVYVDLEAIRDHPGVDQRITNKYLEEMKESDKDVYDPEERKRLFESYTIDTEILKRSMLPQPQGQKLTFICANNAKMVILGEPGSGKSTLLLNLTASYGNALKSNIERFLSSDGQGLEIPDLGNVRIPIRVRVANYADSRREPGGSNLSLSDFILDHCAGKEFPLRSELALLLKRFMDRGKCLFLLDGLDEINDYNDRREITQQVESFVQANSQKSQESQNHFIVTSRIAGYRFEPLSGRFEHYTISPLTDELINKFLKQWCRVIEAALNPLQNANDLNAIVFMKTEKIFKDIASVQGAAAMSTNPLLLYHLMLVHYKHRGKLPANRAKLYDLAVEELLKLRPIEKEISPKRLFIHLESLAYWIHENRGSAHIDRFSLLRIMAQTEAIERGEDKDNPSIETQVYVEQLVNIIRERGGGLFMERGENLYGFRHLTFEEYFAGRYMVSNSNRTREIKPHLHAPRWREPILLAVGWLVDQSSGFGRELLRQIKDADSPFEKTLHRDILFVAECLTEGLYVPENFSVEVIKELIEIYSEKMSDGCFMLLRRQIEEALKGIYQSQDEVVRDDIHRLLAQMIQEDNMHQKIQSLLTLIQNTEVVGNEQLFQALWDFQNPILQPVVWEMMYTVHHEAALRNNLFNGWHTYQNDKSMCQLMGILWIYVWNEKFQAILNLTQSDIDRIKEIVNGWKQLDTLPLCDELIMELTSQRIPSNILVRFIQLHKLTQSVWNATPADTKVKAALESLLARFTIMTKNEPLQSSISEWEEVNDFIQTIEISRQELKDVRRCDLLEKIGKSLLAKGKQSHTLAPIFAEYKSDLPPLEPWSADTVQSAIGPIVNKVAYDLFERLKDTNTNRVREFYEIAIFLLDACGKEYQARTLNYLFHILDRKGTERTIWALQILQKYGFSNLPNQIFSIWQSSLHTPSNETVLAQGLLFRHQLTPELLTICWKILRNPQHPLHSSISDNLKTVNNVQGSHALLAVLNEALQDEQLRESAIGLLRKVEWSEETYKYAMFWILKEKGEPRHIASLLLIGGKQIDYLRGRRGRDLFTPAMHFSLGDFIKSSIPVMNLFDVPFMILAKVLVEEKLQNDLTTGMKLDEWMDKIAAIESPSDPVVQWINMQLASYNLNIRTPPEQLVNLFLIEDSKVTLAAILCLTLFHDPYVLVLPIIFEAALGKDDLIRWKAEIGLTHLVPQLPSNRSSKAIDLLQQLYQKACDEPCGYKFNAGGITNCVRYLDSYWLNWWISLYERGSEKEQHFAEEALSISIVSREVLDSLIAVFLDKTQQVKARIAIVDTLQYILQTFSPYDPLITPVLTEALGDPEIKIAHTAAFGLRWAIPNVTLINALDNIIWDESKDSSMRVFALVVLGKHLYTLKNDPLSGDRVVSIVAKIEQLVVADNATPAIVKRGAYSAIARYMHGSDQRIEYLKTKLKLRDNGILQALIDASSDYDWLYKEQKSNEPISIKDYYRKEIASIVAWINEQTDDIKAELVDQLLLILEVEVKTMHLIKDKNDVQLFSGWPKRRIVTLVLAQFADYLISRSDKHSFNPERIVPLFVKLANDSESVNVRRYAIRMLGLLNRLTSSVVDLLFTVFQDKDIVYFEALKSVEKYNSFGSGSLEKLTEGIDSRSGIVAMNAAILLGALGMYRFREIGNDARMKIAEKLDSFLKSPNAKRSIYLLDDSYDVREIPFCDIIFNCLLRLMSGTGFGRLDSTAADRLVLQEAANQAEKIDESLSLRPDSTKILQSQAREMQSELAKEIIQDSDGNIEASISGDQRFQTITINGQIDHDLVLQLNRAIKESQQLAAFMLQQISGFSPSIIFVPDDLSQLRQQALSLQDQLAKQEIVISETGIDINITGDQRITSLRIDEESQEELIILLNRLIKKSQELAAKKLQQMTSEHGGQLNNTLTTDNQDDTDRIRQRSGDLDTLRRQAIQMQEELASEKVSTTQGSIEITISGDQKILSVTIGGQLQEELISPLNEAIKKSQELAAKKLQQMTGEHGGQLNNTLTTDNQDDTDRIRQRSGDLDTLRRQAIQMQEELASEKVSTTQGSIEITISGDQKILSVTIGGQLQEELISPLNEAIKKSQELAAKKLQQMASDREDENDGEDK